MKITLEEFNISWSSREAEDYIERFEIWCLTQDELSEEKKNACFLSSVGKECYSMIKNLLYPVTPLNAGFEKIKATILHHVKPIQFEAAERSRFHNIVRNPGQGIREFILHLQETASKCNFEDQLDIQLRDRLIAGINDPNLQKQLLLIPDATFSKVRAFCEQNDDVTLAINSQNNSSSHNYDNALMIQSQRSVGWHKIKNTNSQGRNFAINRSNQFRRNFNEQPIQGRDATKIGQCRSCGKSHLRETCKFRNARCFKCNKIGHIQNCCNMNNVQFTNSNTAQSYEDLHDDFNTLSLNTSDNTCHYINAFLKTDLGCSHEFIIDTGSNESLISLSNLKLFAPNAAIKKTEKVLRGITGHSISVMGESRIELYYKDSRLYCDFIVTKDGPSILGLKNMKKMNIDISMHIRSENSTEIRNIIRKLDDAKGGMKIEPIDLRVSGDPVFMKRRILPYGMMEKVQQELRELCSRGILEPVESSIWGTPIVAAIKSDGQRVRICGDYRLTLNPKLLQKTCTTLEPEDILNKLTGSVIFSKLDLKDAYLQIPLTSKSSELTTINTPFGLFRYKFLPFGLTTSPAIFQDIMNKITRGLSGVAIYQDDIIVHASNKKEHDEFLMKLLDIFLQYNISINSKKCTFNVEKFECLGFIVDRNGYRPNIRRIEALAGRPPPTNLSELKSIIGAIQYYARFIPSFTNKAAILLDLLHQDDFVWTRKHNDCLDQLLSFLRSDAVLRVFSPKLLPVLITDASPVGIGAILEQNGHPVICISRKLSKAEQGYSQTHREALAVYWAVKRLHKYLFGVNFKIVTDHEALKFVYNPVKSLSRSSAAMVQRWCIALSAYSYTVEYRSGKQIPHADFLSRQPLMSPEADSDCLLVQPMPMNREQLIFETAKYYGSVRSAVKKGWTTIQKKRFPVLYTRREELSVSPDGIITMQDRVLIPPSIIKLVLNDLHTGHIGIDKMKSLARISCWWPEIDSDIRHFTANCASCRKKSSSRPSQWVPWPNALEPWQRVHADYCGPFLGKYYALIVIDSYSKWPEVFFTTSATAETTKNLLRNVFCHEGVPLVLVTDNGTHFKNAIVDDWLHELGCRHLFTPPRHPCSNGQAENFVRTLKNAIQASNPSTISDLIKCTDNFLLQYRNASHSTTGRSPALMSKGRPLRSNMLCLESAEVEFYRGNEYTASKGIVLKNLGRRMLQIMDLSDCSIHQRHLDQVHFKPMSTISSSPTFLPSTNSLQSSVLSDSQTIDVNDQSVTNVDETEHFERPLVRRSERIRLRTQENNNQDNPSCSICN